MGVKYLTIIFLIVNYLIAIPVWQIIHKHISKKALLSVTLVDLIYRDVVLYTLAISGFITAGFVHILLFYDNTFSLPFEWAMFYAASTNVFTNCVLESLIISAGLRLIAIVQNFEAAGTTCSHFSSLNLCLIWPV